MGATLRIVRIVKISPPNNVKNAKGGTYQGLLCASMIGMM
jgi:hypothetical protein